MNAHKSKQRVKAHKYYVRDAMLYAFDHEGATAYHLLPADCESYDAMILQMRTNMKLADDCAQNCIGYTELATVALRAIGVHQPRKVKGTQ